jgi:hypothetical protein
MNARQSFYSSVFEQINDYKRKRGNDGSRTGFLTDHMVEFGVFSAVLVITVFGGFNLDFNQFFTSSRQALKPNVIKITQAPAADIFTTEDTSASEGEYSEPEDGMIVRPSDDAYVSEDNPGRSFGYDQVLRVDKDPVRSVYLKFSIPKDKPFSHAILRLYAKDNNETGGTVYVGNDNIWSERLLTYDSQPNVGEEKIGDIGAVAAGVPVSIDVTGAVEDRTVVTFKITSDSEDGVDYAAKESSTELSPQLVLSE